MQLVFFAGGLVPKIEDLFSCESIIQRVNGGKSDEKERVGSGGGGGLFVDLQRLAVLY